MTTVFLLWILATAENETIAARIDQMLTLASETGGYAGAVLVAREGEVLLRKGYGLADREAGTPFDVNTVTTIGSITKQFTGAAIMKLVSMKKLNPDDTLNRFFDDLPEDKREITIHQLLTHSAGLVDVIGAHDFDMMPKQAFFEKLFASELLYVPGSKHRYSNAGYSLLAHILERVTGQDYESFLRQHLFLPAGMKETGYLLPDWPIDRVARGYARGVFDMGTLVGRFREHGVISWNLKGNGGIHSTLEDMYRWCLALQTNKILTPELTEQMTRPYIEETPDGDSHYAYGWAIFRSDRDTKIISHNGGNGIFFHDLLWLPEEEVVILFHTNGVRPELELAWTIERMIFDPAYRPRPLGPNPYQRIHEFVEDHDVASASELEAQMEGSDWLRSPRVLYELGFNLLETDPAWALALLEINSRRFPENGRVWQSLGRAYLSRDQREQAREAFQKAVSLGNEDAIEALENLEQ